MADNDRLIQNAINTGGKDWVVLADAARDTDFHQILSNQEKNLLSQIIGNPNLVGSYQDHFANIISKYIGWKVYKDSNLRELKKKISELSNKIDESGNELQTIRNTAKHIGGATILVEYSKAFAKTAGNHQTKAEEQLRWYLISLAGFATIIGFVFFFSISEFSFLQGMIASDLKGLPLNTGFFALKVFLLVFAYQITQFFRKNYGAEKHLQEVYQHRSDVLQSLHAVYNALTDTSEKDKILSAGALFAYERGETGYITTKEGAGSGEGLIEGILGKSLR